MNGKQWSVVIAAIAVLAGIFWMAGWKSEAPAPAPEKEAVQATVDPMNLSFDIERNIIQLRNGEAIQEVQGTCKGGVCPTLRYETRVFGEPVRGDLNGDGAEDAAMILTQKLGGTGTFYYVVAGLADPDGGVSAGGEVFLGDRIAPQTMRIADGIIEVNYADRRPQDSFATPPSVGKTIRIKVENGDLVRL